MILIGVYVSISKTLKPKYISLHIDQIIKKHEQFLFTHLFRAIINMYKPYHVLVKKTSFELNCSDNIDRIKKNIE